MLLELARLAADGSMGITLGSARFIGEAIQRSPVELREAARNMVCSLICAYAGSQSQSDGSPCKRSVWCVLSGCSITPAGWRPSSRPTSILGTTPPTTAH
jgi:hypothetical protein